MAVIARYLIDTSAAARMKWPAVATRLAPLIDAGPMPCKKRFASDPWEPSMGDPGDASRTSRPMVRVLKNWRTGVTGDTPIKSLVMEVLALQCLPRSGNRPEALRHFFTAAAVQVNLGVEDPAPISARRSP